MADDAIGTAFNFDAAQLIILFGIKDEILSLFGDFTHNHEIVYSKVRDFWREIDALPRESSDESKKLTGSMELVTALRNIYLSAKTKENLNNYFLIMEALYLDLCRTLKAHKIYYREGLDPSRAALRR